VRERKYLLLIVLGTFFLVMFNLPESVSQSLRGGFREGIASYQGAIMRALAKVHRPSTARVKPPADLSGDNERLRLEIAALRSETTLLERVARENKELRNLLGFRQRVTDKTVACQVIARDDGYGWWQTIRLDKGRDDGVSENQPVITPEGLVGKTIDVSGQTCDVLLISDRNFKVAVRFDQEGSYGILHGGGVSLRGVHSLGVICAPVPFQVEYLRKDMTIKPGERVVTSGLGGVFPEGLVVGQVGLVAPDETGLYQVATVVPAADLARLRQVLVVMGKK
jgi:rod shape-determining protein MreC